MRRSARAWPYHLVWLAIKISIETHLYLSCAHFIQRLANGRENRARHYASAFKRGEKSGVMLELSLRPSSPPTAIARRAYRKSSSLEIVMAITVRHKRRARGIEATIRATPRRGAQVISRRRNEMRHQRYLKIFIRQRHFAARPMSRRITYRRALKIGGKNRALPWRPYRALSIE